MQKIRKNDLVTNGITLLLFMTSFWAVVWALRYGGLSNYGYYTNQSNFLVFIIVMLFLIQNDKKKWFPYLAAITLIDMFMTSIIFHLLIATPPITFQNHLTHTINPILFVLFYFLVYPNSIKLRHSYILLLHPVLYFSIFLVIGNVTGFYPYGFMNVTINGLSGVLKTSAFIILPLIAIMSFFLMAIKKKIEQSDIE
ncbi:MAG: Pr6Pr family membrane protein [Acholeplasmataceae bacterium]|nr:Pr6Pr family membrane protein [Acholeplasmataceae bacterium]